MDIIRYFQGAQEALKDVKKEVEKMIDEENKSEYGVEVYSNGKVAAYFEVIELINSGLNQKKSALL